MTILRRIIIISSLIFFLSYSIYLTYQHHENNKHLTEIKDITATLKKDYNIHYDEVVALEQQTVSLTNEINNITVQVNEKETTLEKINNQIAAIQAEIKKKKAEQIKKLVNTNSGTKVAYLTFDDGPSSYSDKILNILKEYGIKATFFVNGREDTYSLNIYRRIVNEGHSIGNHSYSHNYKTAYSSIDAFDNNFNRLQNLILNTTGVTMDIMRFPGGSNNSISNNYSHGIMDALTTRYKDLGYIYYDWNVSAGDSWEGVTTSYVINNITSQSSYKSYVIILMHDTIPTTPSSLPTIIQNLTSLGYNFQPIVSSTTAIQFK